MNAPAPLAIGKREFVWGARTFVMGIINVTPDSFSGDGLGTDVEAAVAQGLRFDAEGADILDVGGESTRPGSGGERRGGDATRPAGHRGWREQTATPISIDTTKAEVAAPRWRPAPSW